MIDKVLKGWLVALLLTGGAMLFNGCEASIDTDPDDDVEFEVDD